MKTIGITGGTGMVGTHLTSLLLSKGYEVIIFTRRVSLGTGHNGLSYAHWDEARNECDNAALRRLDAMVHLAGAGIADKRWTAERKKVIRDSRVKGTEFLVRQLKAHSENCKIFISASAMGYYGPSKSGHPAFKETDTYCNDFLGNTCKEWEAEAHKAEALARTVILRFGIVLGKEAGAFPQYNTPLSLGVMPVLGYGSQIVSWIEANDLARLILYALQHKEVAGIYNAVSPHPVSQKTMIKAIADAKGGLKIPISVPPFLLKTLLGEMSIEVLKSCEVSSDKIQATGFSFNHPDIDGAVRAILKK